MKRNPSTVRGGHARGAALLVSGLLALVAPVAAAPQNTHCTLTQGAYAAGGVRSLDVTVAHDGARVLAIDASSSFSAREGLGFSCNINLRRGNGQSRWTSLGPLAIASASDAVDQSSVVTVTSASGAFVVNLGGVNSEVACGAGAALPTYVVVPRAGKKCLFHGWDSN